MDSWIDFNTNKSVTSVENDVPENAIGFVYLIEIDGYMYIGKKNLYSTTTKHFGKKKLAEVVDKRKKTYEKVTKESDWKKYCSSNKTIKELLNSGSKPTRYILEYGYSKQHLTYLEVLYQFKFQVLENDKSLNDNILGKFYRKIFNFTC